MSELEEIMALHLRAAGLPTPLREARVNQKRRWRFDFAWPDLLVALEVEGGTMARGLARGRHTRGSGFEKDCEKYNEATLAGWRVYRVTGEQVRSGQAVALMERVFDAELGEDEKNP